MLKASAKTKTTNTWWYFAISKTLHVYSAFFIVVRRIHVVIIIIRVFL